MTSAATKRRPPRPTLVMRAIYARQSKQARSKRERDHRVEDFSLVVQEGESVGLLGSPLDGTPLVLKLATGLVAPDEGDIYIRTQPAVIDAASAFALDETLAFNVERVAMNLEINGAKLRAAVNAILAQTGMDDQADELCSDIEAVDVERVRLAAVLHARPSLVLIDDPLARGRALMDEDGRERIGDYLNRQGSILLVGRTPQVMRRVCSRIVWLHEGKVIMDGPVAAVAREHGRMVSVGDDKAKAAQMYRRFARQHQGIHIVLQGTEQ